MIILVTGGAGFIGSHFIRLMLQGRAGCRVINLDKLTYSGNLQNLKDVDERDGGKRYFFVHGDICDAALVNALFSGSHPVFQKLGTNPARGSAECGIDAVVHFAAESHVDRSIQDASNFYQTNVEGTRLLLENARRFWGSETSSQRFIHVSTDEVYGSLNPGEPQFTEESPVKPNSPYAASKAAADLMVLAYAHTYRVPAIVTRCGNNYGPYQHPEKFIPLFITNAIDNLPLPLYGDGLQVRDWIHVEDHCRALMAVLERGELSAVYNIGAAEEHANRDVAELIVRTVGKAPSLIQPVRDRAGHDRRYALDTSKIRSRLAWYTERPFRQGLQSTVRWYQEHEDWWRPIKDDAFWKYYREAYGAL